MTDIYTSARDLVVMCNDYLLDSRRTLNKEQFRAAIKEVNFELDKNLHLVSDLEINILNAVFDLCEIHNGMMAGAIGSASVNLAVGKVLEQAAEVVNERDGMRPYYD